MKRVLAFGNPLLDTIVFIKDDSLLKKYNLKPDGQKEITDDEMKSLIKDIELFEKTLSSGGCAQNTLKVMQWLSKNDFHATIFGCVGNDPEGITLQQILKKHGVQTNYIKHNNYSTGSTVSLVFGESRSLVAYLGAAEVLSLNDVDFNVELLNLIENVELIYMEGFFLTKRIEAASFILNQCASLHKEFVFNLSGDYLCREYPDVVKHFLDKSRIIFGNRREFQVLCSFMNESTAENLVRNLGEKGKIVAMTNGPSSVICIDDNGKICEIEVPKLKDGEVVDTTGAGDSFVAGFLTGYLLKRPLEVCAKLGVYAAQEIIRKRGSTIPEFQANFQE